MLKIQYENRNTAASTQLIEFSVKVVNVGTIPFPLGHVSVRYYYIQDRQSVQAGTCTSVADPSCVVAFYLASPSADAWAELLFSPDAETLQPGADTGEIPVEIHGSGNYDQTTDYSFSDTGATFVDDVRIAGYLYGNLAWGTPPSSPASGAGGMGGAMGHGGSAGTAGASGAGGTPH